MRIFLLIIAMLLTTIQLTLAGDETTDASVPASNEVSPALPSRPEGSLVTFALASFDPEWTESFYGKLFGWQFQPLDAECVLFKAPGGEGGVFRIGAAPEMDRAALYINCLSVRDKLNEVAAAGGNVVQQEQALPGFGWTGQFIDPDGNTIGLFSAENPPPLVAEGATCNCGH